MDMASLVNNLPNFIKRRLSGSVPGAPSIPDPPPPPPSRIVTFHDINGKGAQPLQKEQIVMQALPGSDPSKIVVGPAWRLDQVPANDNNTAEDGAKREPPKDAKSKGLVMPKGVNVSYTDFGPGFRTPMHRTVSVDFNILISGELWHITEDGQIQHISQPGEIVIQRGTMHAWENPSKDKWARMCSVLVAAEPIVLQPPHESDGEVVLEEEWI